MLIDDIDRVAAAISQKYGNLKEEPFDYGWEESAALSTLDCVRDSGTL